MNYQDQPLVKARNEIARENLILRGEKPIPGQSAAEQLAAMVEAEQRNKAALATSQRKELRPANDYAPRQDYTNVPAGKDKWVKIHRDNFTAEHAQALIDLYKDIASSRSEFDFLTELNRVLVAR